MYLLDIKSFDNSWPEDDQDCLEKLHTVLGMRALRSLQETISMEALAAAAKHIPSLSSMGFNPVELVTDESVALFSRTLGSSRDDEDGARSEDDDAVDSD